jgi:hypothetical protein
VSSYNLGEVYAGLQKAKADLVLYQEEFLRHSKSLEDTLSNKNGLAHNEAYTNSLKKRIMLSKLLVELCQRAIKLDEQYLQMNAQKIAIDRKIDELPYQEHWNGRD